MLHIRKRIKDIFGGHPVEGSHGESVIASLSDSKLFGKVIKGIEGVAGIELLIIFSVAAFYFTIVTGCKGFDFLVPDAEFSQCFLKERQRFVLNCTPFVRQYDILSNKWGVILCQKEFQTNGIQQNSKDMW